MPSLHRTFKALSLHFRPVKFGSLKWVLFPPCWSPCLNSCCCHLAQLSRQSGWMQHSRFHRAADTVCEKACERSIELEPQAGGPSLPGQGRKQRRRPVHRRAADRETFARAAASSPSWSSRAGRMQVAITTATAPNDKIEKGHAQAKVCPHHPNDRDRQTVTDMIIRGAKETGHFGSLWTATAPLSTGAVSEIAVRRGFGFSAS